MFQKHEVEQELRQTHVVELAELQRKMRGQLEAEREILSNLTLIMANPSDAQPGVYVCIATNEPGQYTANAELTVLGKYFVNSPCRLTSSTST